MRTALPKTREAWRALLVDIQGNIADDSWKQWLDSWETPSEVKSRENVERWKKSVNKIKGIGALLGKDRRPSQVFQALGNLRSENPEASESLRPSGSLRPPSNSPARAFQAFMPQGSGEAGASQGDSGNEGTASSSWTRQRRPSVAASSVAENWSPDYAGSGGRRESSFKQDRRDSQVLGEFRDIYARRESQMSQGSGVGSMGLGSLPLSSASAAYLAVPGPRKSQRSPSGVFSASGSEFSFTSSASPKRMAGEFERLIPKGTPSKDSPSPYTSPFTSQQSSPRRSAATSSDKDRSAASSTSRRGSRRKSTLKRAGSNLLKDDK